MKKLEFYKYHALGNDFLVIDLINRRPGKIDYNRMALDMCSRNSGVGADGILVLSRSNRADCCIDLFNSDGSWAEKSGNGLRIAAAYYHRKYARRKKLIFEIGGDSVEARIIRVSLAETMVRVSLGRPEFETRRVPMKSKAQYHINAPLKIEGVKIPATILSVGNPHTVIFVDRFDFDWKLLGEIIENSRYFPHRTNVEFVRIVNRKKIVLNDWERGAGATGSSGTGASAAVAAGVVNGYLERAVEVVFPTGSLRVEWPVESDNIILTGPAVFVCRGEYVFDPDRR
nr:diaminopimelate epimerase [candidate division Zixibacteria bacterium]